MDRTKSVPYLVRDQGPFGLQGGRYAGARDIGRALALGRGLADCSEPGDAYFAVLLVSFAVCGVVRVQYCLRSRDIGGIVPIGR